MWAATLTDKHYRRIRDEIEVCSHVKIGEHALAAEVARKRRTIAEEARMKFVENSAQNIFKQRCHVLVTLTLITTTKIAEKVLIISSDDESKEFVPSKINSSLFNHRACIS